MKMADLGTPLVQSKLDESPTGLPGYYEGVKQGKILVFNLNEINLAGLLGGGHLASVETDSGEESLRSASL